MLICNACGAPEMKVVVSRDLGGSHSWDENAVQVLRCGACSQWFAGLYCEERRGARERVRHQSVPLDAMTGERFAAAFDGATNEQIGAQFDGVVQGLAATDIKFAG